MAEVVGDYDAESDELIKVIVDQAQSNSDRAEASKKLYRRHADWVVQQIGKKIFNPDDIQDIAQNVWMMVLRPDKLGKDYTERRGRFRAFLRSPIRWSILKHIDKLPFSLDESGNKMSVQVVDVNEAMFEEGIDKTILENVIDNIIKPNLKTVELRSRNIYVLNEFNVIFESDPELDEIAEINGLNLSDAHHMIKNTHSKEPAECTDEELSVYLPTKYRTIVDPELLDKSSGRYLANLIGVTEAVYRKRLHVARKTLIEIVRTNLPKLTGNHN